MITLIVNAFDESAAVTTARAATGIPPTTLGHHSPKANRKV